MSKWVFGVKIDFIFLIFSSIVIEDSVRYLSNNVLNSNSFLKSLTFATAMSFHSILEGFALGVQVSQRFINSLVYLGK